MLRKRSIYFIGFKKIPPYIKEKKIPDMKKNSGDIFETIEVDPISGQYFIHIPEQIMNELEWYEDTKIKFSIESNEVVLTEVD